jgi:Zn-dependent protease
MELFGIRIRVHPTFFWLVLLFLLIGGLNAVAWLVLVFTFVVLHELCHGLVARAHGIPVHGITLLPIGGVAQLGAMPEDSATELRIAFAGPVFNFSVAGLSYLVLAGTGTLLGEVLFGLIEKVFIINLALGTFNLLPAFPMDGGRVLRAYLARKRGFLEATHQAARVGRWIAGGMAVLAIAALFNEKIVVNPVLLLLVAGFVYVSGKQEEMSVAARHAARGFWNLFGYGEQTPGPRRSPGADERPRGDVIDVEGTARRADDRPADSAAEAFRQLGNDIDSQLRR